MHRLTYKVVSAGGGENLYDRVRNLERQWLVDDVLPKIRNFIQSSLSPVYSASATSNTTVNERRVVGEAFLRTVRAAWEDFRVCTNMTSDIFLFMDRRYCQDKRIPNVYPMCMGLWRDNILYHPMAVDGSETNIFDTISRVILDMVKMERQGDVIERNLIHSCIEMFESLYQDDSESEDQSLYLTRFEPQFLAKSREFYMEETEDLLRGGDAGKWLRDAERRLTEEKTRAETTISPTSLAKVTTVIEQELLTSHLQEFLQLESTGIKSMLTYDKYDNLKLLYELMSKIDVKKEALRNALQNQVMNMGCDINKAIQNTDFSAEQEVPADGPKPKMNAAALATAAAIRWVDDVLTLKDKFDRMWIECFDEDLILQTALTKSFSDFINLFPQAPEYVSLFIDSNLKSGVKGRTEGEIDEVLDKAVILLRYVQDKDMIERYYQKHFARRLLYGKSESDEVEQQMISRMKQEAGHNFTNKLEGMYKDMMKSEDLSSGYKEYIASLGAAASHTVDLGVKVLTTNFWPTEAMNAPKPDAPRIIWPKEISSLQQSFTKFYEQGKSGRQLTWMPYIGTADIRCTFPKISGKEGALGRERRYEINASTQVMIVLLLFNSLPPGASLTISEIQERTNVSLSELQRVMPTISILPKAKVLNKEPPTKKLSPGDRFSFNEAFVSKSVKIKVPTIAGGSKVESGEERRETEHRNDAARVALIEAAVVRTMKYVSFPS
jgi:cullin 3